MKKNLKKTVVLGLAATMVVSCFTGCGKETSSSSKKGNAVKKEINEVLAGAVSSTENMDSLGIDVSAELKVSGKEDDDKISIEASGNISGKFDLENYNLSGDGSAKYSLAYGDDEMSGEYDADVYGDTDDDDLFTVYFKNPLDGAYYTDSIDISGYTSLVDTYKDSISEVSDALEEIDESTFEDYGDLLSLESKTEYVNKKECYVITADLSQDTLEEYAESMGEDLDDVMGEYDSFDDYTITYKLYFDKDTYVPVRFQFDTTGNIDEDGTELTVDKCNITIDLDTDDVEVESVPKKAKKNAEEIALFSTLEDEYLYDDDYDYDYDDYDYDYDDDDDNTSSYTTIDSIPATYKFENISYTLGKDTVSKMTSNGWTIEDQYKDLKVAAGENEFVYLKSGDVEASLTVYNDTNSELGVSDCKIGGIDVDNWSMDVTGFTDGNGISICESTREDVEKAYSGKEPYLSDDSYLEYETENFDTINYFFDETGLVTSINIDMYSLYSGL